MDYKEKYETALGRARELYMSLKEHQDWVASYHAIENIFPELAESEDEQSKKWILEYLYDGLRKSDCDYNSNKSRYAEGSLDVTHRVKHFINTLEMKEVKEEPASEDLEEAAVEAFKQIVDSDKNNFLEIFKAGAKWQKEQFEKERLKHCDALTAEQAQIESDFVVQHLKENNRTPTFIDAIEYGMRFTKATLLDKEE